MRTSAYSSVRTYRTGSALADQMDVYTTSSHRDGNGVCAELRRGADCTPIPTDQRKGYSSVPFKRVVAKDVSFWELDFSGKLGKVLTGSFQRLRAFSVVHVGL